MKKLSLLVAVFCLAVLPACWKKKAEDVKPEVKTDLQAPVAQLPVEPVRESTPVPAPAEMPAK